MGQEVPADSLGEEWTGYVLRVTGGNDKQVSLHKIAFPSPGGSANVLGFPNEAGCPRQPPSSSPPFRRPLVLPSPPRRREEEEGESRDLPKSETRRVLTLYSLSEVLLSVTTSKSSRSSSSSKARRTSQDSPTLPSPSVSVPSVPPESENSSTCPRRTMSASSVRLPSAPDLIFPAYIQ